MAAVASEPPECAQEHRAQDGAVMSRHGGRPLASTLLLLRTAYGSTPGLDGAPIQEQIDPVLNRKGRRAPQRQHARTESPTEGRWCRFQINKKTVIYFSARLATASKQFGRVNQQRGLAERGTSDGRRPILTPVIRRWG
jgi:hypothetical protein